MSLSRSLVSVLRTVFGYRVVAVVLIDVLVTVQCAAVSAPPPGILPIPGLNKVLLEKLGEEALSYFLGQQISSILPLKLDAGDALPTVPDDRLPGGPFHGKPLKLTAKTASEPLAKGDYEVHFTAYCTQFSVHRAGRNAASVIAPLDGAQARTIGRLLWRGTQAGRNPQDLQNAAWAIQNGAHFSDLTKAEQDDITTFAPGSRAGLEDRLDFLKPVQELYGDITSHPRKYIIQYKHELEAKHELPAVAKYLPDALIPDFRLSAPTFDDIINHLGELGKLYKQTVEDQKAFSKYLTARAHGEEKAYIAPTDPPLPAANGPWTVRAGGRAYIRAAVQSGNLSGDNILQIRVTSDSKSAQTPRAARLVEARYEVQQSTPVADAGPSVLDLVSAPAKGLNASTSPLFKMPTPVRDPIPARIPAPVVTSGTVAQGELELAEELDPEIIYMLIAAQALILVLSQVKAEQGADCPDDLPVLTFSKERIPNIADHINKQQNVHPEWKVLTKASDQIDDNRTQASPACRALRIAPGSGQSCDEYPFASTVEGGRDAVTAEVPLRENRSQGGTIKNFYAGKPNGTRFCVVVGP